MKTHCCNCVYGETTVCLFPNYTIGSMGECLDYIDKNNQSLKDTLKKLDISLFDFVSYDKQDRDWMLDTKKHPPTAQQLTIAFGKYINGYRPGDELWSEEDQDAYIYSI